MDLVAIIGLAIALGADAFAAAAAAGAALKEVTGRQIFRLAWHFGFFQFVMPLLGWLIGRGAVKYVAAWSRWIAFGLLTAVGVKALLDSLAPKEEELKKDPTRGLYLVALSVATSLDALAVGGTLAFLKVEIFTPCLIIGLVAALMTIAGVHLGRRLGALFGRRVETAGALVLLGLAAKLLFDTP